MPGAQATTLNLSLSGAVQPSASMAGGGCGHSGMPFPSWLSRVAAWQEERVGSGGARAWL